MPNNKVTAMFRIKFDKPLTEQDLEDLQINSFTVTFKHKKQTVAVKAICKDQPAIEIDKTDPRFLNIAYKSYILCDHLHDENLYKIKQLELLDMTNYTDKVPERITRFYLTCAPKHMRNDQFRERIKSNNDVSIFKNQTKRFHVLTIIQHGYPRQIPTVEYHAIEKVYEKTRIA